VTNQTNTNLLTTREVAQHYRVTRTTVFSWVRDHNCPVIRLPGGYRFDPLALAAWAESHGGRG
jgi:excisionase family DNA binding protein